MTAQASLEVVNRQVALPVLQNVARSAVRDLYPGTLKFDLYTWIVNYCKEDDLFMVIAPDFSLSLATMLQLYHRNLTLRKRIGSKYQVSLWRLLLQEVEGFAVKRNLRTTAKQLNDLCDALAELISQSSQNAKSLTTLPDDPLTTIIRAKRRPRTVDKPVAQPAQLTRPPVDKHLPATTSPETNVPESHTSAYVPTPTVSGSQITVIKAVTRKKRNAKVKSKVIRHYDGYCARQDAAVEIPEDPKACSPLQSGLSSTVCPSNGLQSESAYQEPSYTYALPVCTEHPEPPSDWQMHADDDTLVLYQQVYKPAVCRGTEVSSTSPQQCGSTDPPPICPMSIPWEQPFLQ